MFPHLRGLACELASVLGLISAAIAVGLLIGRAYTGRWPTDDDDDLGEGG